MTEVKLPIIRAESPEICVDLQQDEEKVVVMCKECESDGGRRKGVEEVDKTR